MLNFVKNIDFISMETKVLINGKYRYKNYLGGFFSLFYFISIIVISAILIIKFFNRDIIISIYNEEILLNPEYSIKNNPFFFQVYDHVGNNIEEVDRILKISAFIYNIEITYSNGVPQRKVYSIDLPLKNCTEVIDQYYEFRQLIETNYYQDKICLDPNQNILLKGLGGDGNNSTVIFINMEKCNNSTVLNPKGCFRESYINSVLIKPMITIRFLDHIIDNNDIENPYKPFIRGDLFYFSGNMVKIVNYLLCNVEYKNDLGIFYDEYISKYFTIYDEKYIDISILPNSVDLILRINFTLAKKKMFI